MDGNSEDSDKRQDVTSTKKDLPSGLHKVCLVCGDKALGYNFNAISCESCKAFFRRNALTNKNFKCPFTNNCEINVVTRRFCQKCRMVKCLAVGMVKEFIMSEQDKAEKRKKIEENRAKKRQGEPSNSASKSKNLKIEDGNSNTSKEDSNSAFKDNNTNAYRDENSNEFIDNNSNTYPDEACSTTAYLFNNSSAYRKNLNVYKQENTSNSYRENETSMYQTENSTIYRDITVKNREDSCFSYRDNTIPYKDDNTMSLRENTIPFKPDSSIPFRDENTNVYTNQTPESTLQYDVLNSSTCSPNSSIQSPQSNDVDTSINSPVYHPYTVRNNEMPYAMRGNSINDRRTLNSVMYDPRADGFGASSGANGMCPDRKPNCIRSILTNGEAGQQHICDQTPSTSMDPNVNKAKEILQDVERIEPNSMESILCEAIKLEFEAYTSVNPCPSSRELNEVERAKLNELIVANKALHVPIDDDISILVGDTTVGIKENQNGGHDPRLVTIVNLTAVAIRRFIKMAKKINAFKNMCEEDQIALLKGGCIEMLVLRSAMQYDGQRNTWKVPHSHEEYGTIRTDVLKLAKGNVYSKHEAFIRSFEHRWRTDENIILVMSAILLFTPDRPKVVHRDVIKLEQNSYYYLLRRYLESVYAGCEAKSTFLKLIQKILELRKLAEEVTEVYLDVNPIEPLLMEIFDLKQIDR